MPKPKKVQTKFLKISLRGEIITQSINSRNLGKTKTIIHKINQISRLNFNEIF